MTSISKKGLHNARFLDFYKQILKSYKFNKRKNKNRAIPKNLSMKF
jgi:hypothetical protein